MIHEKKPTFISDVMKLLNLKEKEISNESELKEIVFKHAKVLFGAQCMMIDFGESSLPSCYLVSAEPKNVLNFHYVMIAHTGDGFKTVGYKLLTFLELVRAETGYDLVTTKIMEFINNTPEVKADFLKICKVNRGKDKPALECNLANPIFLITEDTTPKIEKKFEESPFWKNYVQHVILKRSEISVPQFPS